MTSNRRTVWAVIATTVVAIVVVIAVSVYAITGLDHSTETLHDTRQTIVEGTSMEPTFHPGDVVELSDKPSVERDDIAVFTAPDTWYVTSQLYLIKRVYAAPGDTISFHDNTLWVNDTNPYPIRSDYTCSIPSGSSRTLTENQYFMVGDNYNNSVDSLRAWCGNNESMFVDSEHIIISGEPTVVDHREKNSKHIIGK